jgi:hypothetical protein
LDKSGFPMYRAVEMHSLKPSDFLLKLTTAATFSEVCAPRPLASLFSLHVCLGL